MKPAVLVVDDSLTVRMDLREAFEDADFATTLCATGAAAREVLSRAHFHLVVLDVLLPDVDGIELLKEIKGSLAPSTPVILLSSEAEVRDRIRGLRTGADDYVGKPYDARYLVARARELVRDLAPRAADTARILVIDDSTTFREALREQLEAAGYAVLTAASGEEGLRRAAECKPDGIIVDSMMPGLDGPAVISRIRLDAALRRTPCILLTASDERQDELRALDSGADAFVHKGEGVEVALARLAVALRSAGQAVWREGTRSVSGPRRVLAIDSDREHLDALAARLHEEGHEVVRAVTGEEALELLAVQPVDCVLVGLELPGISGEEVCRRIKASPGLGDVPLLAFGAVDGPEVSLRAINAGADELVSKTIGPDLLKARLRAQLRRKQLQDEVRGEREQALRQTMATAEARAVRELAETRAALLAEVNAKNEELEAFSYSVSHDLRAPLRAILGFSRILEDEHGAALSADAKDLLARVLAAGHRMSQLIDDLLKLARLGRQDMHRQTVELDAVVQEIAEELRGGSPERKVELVVSGPVRASGDPRLLRAALENLVGNAWKYTRDQPHPKVEFGATEEDGVTVYFLRDNGAGFDMAYAGRLFSPFQRLHRADEFEGTGVGLATVKRIIHRHGGRIWAKSSPGAGATFSFTLGPSATATAAQNAPTANA